MPHLRAGVVLPAPVARDVLEESAVNIGEMAGDLVRRPLARTASDLCERHVCIVPVARGLLVTRHAWQRLVGESRGCKHVDGPLRAVLELQGAGVSPSVSLLQEFDVLVILWAVIQPPDVHARGKRSRSASGDHRLLDVIAGRQGHMRRHRHRAGHHPPCARGICHVIFAREEVVIVFEDALQVTKRESSHSCAGQGLEVRVEHIVVLVKVLVPLLLARREGREGVGLVDNRAVGLAPEEKVL